MVEIAFLANMNPWWRNGEEIQKDEKVKEALAKKHTLKHKLPDENLLIVGPRQVGKTTALKQKIFDLITSGTNPKNILFFSCELISKKEEIVEIILAFDRLAEGRKFIFLNEISFTRDWQNAVKFILDSPISRNKVFYVTGSSIAALKKETFPGRNIKLKEFLPLSFREFCILFGSNELRNALKGTTIAEIEMKHLEKQIYFISPFIAEIQSLFEKFLRCGGFPISAYQFIEEGGIKESTNDIYLNWAISDVAKLERSEKIFKCIMQGITKNYGSMFSLNSVAKEMEIGSHVTVREYLELSENLYILRNYFQKKNERPAFRSNRKVYYIDPFLFRTFYRDVYGSAEVPEDKLPVIVEGVVGEHLRRRFKAVSFFSGKKEVDFILGSAGIEVKYGKAVETDFPKAEIKEKILLSKTELKSGKILIAPASAFLALL